MKKFFKRSLLVMVIVLSMIAALCVAVSANTTVPAGTVATVTVGGTTTPYTDFAQAAVAMHRQSGTVEVVLYSDVTVDTPIVITDTLIFKAAPGTNPTVTANITNNVIGGSTPYKSIFAMASATNKIQIEGIDFVITTESDDAAIVTANSTTAATALADGKTHQIVLTDVNVTTSSCVLSQYTPSGGEVGRYVITATDCTFNLNNGEGYLVNIPRSIRTQEEFTFTFNLTNTTVPADAFYNGPNDGAFNETTNANNPIAYFVNYCDDATAKANGYGYRVGDTTSGAPGEVYFATEAEALNVAPAGVKVYNITGAAPVEVAKPCEHTYVDKVVAPTCDKEGYTEHKCSKCNASYNDTPVAALGHKLSAATCTKKATCSVCNAEVGELARHKYGVATCSKKATCSVCGAERGELAEHVDANNDNKCDKCEAKMGADTTAATEEKKGCGGTVTVAGLALVAALGSCAIFVEKKRK